MLLDLVLLEIVSKFDASFIVAISEQQQWGDQFN